MVAAAELLGLAAVAIRLLPFRQTLWILQAASKHPYERRPNESRELSLLRKAVHEAARRVP